VNALQRRLAELEQHRPMRIEEHLTPDERQAFADLEAMQRPLTWDAFRDATTASEEAAQVAYQATRDLGLALEDDEPLPARPWEASR